MVVQITDQPPPVPRGEVVSVQAMVRADLDERERVGRERYGTSLQPFNGRDALIDAYQEAMDLTMYLRQAIAERDGPAPGLEVAHVGSVSGSAYSTSTALDVHGPGAVNGDGLADPAVDGGKQFSDLGAAPFSHMREQLMEQGCDGVDVAILPGPRCLAVLPFGVTAVDVASADDLVRAAYNIFIGHGDYDTDERPGAAVLVVTSGQEEASFTLQQACQPGQIALVHTTECTRTSCAALDLACYLRQAIAERGDGA